MIVVRRETWAASHDDILPLWEEYHSGEAAYGQQLIFRFAPNLALFQPLEDINALFLLVARDTEDNNYPVGVILSMLLPHVSCAHLLVNYVILSYVLPHYRGRGTATALFQLFEKLTGAHGGSAMLVGNKDHLPHGAYFEKIGYKPYGMSYIRWLTQEYDDGVAESRTTRAASKA